MDEQSVDEWPLELPVGKCARLTYGPDFKHDDVLLLEMDEAILQEALVDGCVPFRHRPFKTSIRTVTSCAHTCITTSQRQPDL
jgi:hypothetical protein